MSKSRGLKSFKELHGRSIYKYLIITYENAILYQSQIVQQCIGFYSKLCKNCVVAYDFWGAAYLKVVKSLDLSRNFAHITGEFETILT